MSNPFQTLAKALLGGMLGGMLAFFLGVFLGLMFLIVKAYFSADTPDFTIAYRFVGAPLGVAGFIAGFVYMFFRDARQEATD